MELKIKNVGRALWRIVNMLITLVLVLAVAAAVLGLVNKQEEGKGYPSALGISFFEVLTDSMHPTFSAHALVLTKQVEPDQLNENDIISFRVGEEKGTVLTHRIVGFHDQDGERQLITKGDANSNRDDSFVAPSQVIGKVIFWMPKGGWYLAWMKQPPVIAAMLVFIILQGVISVFLQHRCFAKKGEQCPPHRKESIQTIK